MKQSELKHAEKMLEGRTDRVESIGADTEGGFALTAYWRDGGQRLFYTIREVEEHVESH